MELLRESEQQTQYLMDSQSHHNFKNQLPYSPFQEEPTAKSMGDMIQTQNFVTRSISIEFVTQTHARVPYTSPELMVVHLELVRHEKMSMTLKNLVEMMIPTYFEFVAPFHNRLPNTFLAQIFLQLDILEKKIWSLIWEGL